jgi:flagellar motor switch protein FliG
MADTLREEMAEAGTIRTRAGEEAMTEVVNAVRRLEAAGEITLRSPDDEDGE